MAWYYYNGKDKVGPLTDKPFKQAITSGKIKDTTLIWKPGMKGWQRFQVALRQPEIAALLSKHEIGSQTAQEGIQITCFICRKNFSISEAIPYENKYICLNCKPEFVQRLKEGAPLAATQIHPEEFDRDIIRHDYYFGIFDCIYKSWELLCDNFWLSAGAVILIYLILFVSQIIPFVNYIANLVLSGPLMGGLYYFFIRLARNDITDIGDAFVGFKGEYFFQLMLAEIVQILIMILCAIPFIVFMIYHIGLKALQSGVFLKHPSFTIFLPFILMGIFLIPLFIYLSIAWLYTFPLIIDKKLHFWKATIISFKMSNKHWFKIFGLCFMAGLVSLLGLLVCCIGVVATAPIFFGAMAYAYIEIFKG